MAGGSITVLNNWYYALKQPNWAPPDYMFPIIWTAVFAMVALSGAYAWSQVRSRRDSETLLGLFAFNGFLNLCWSFIFFRMQRPDIAFYELIVFWVSSLLLIIFCSRLSKTSALLLIPYIVWITVAGLLNYQVVELNGPFR